MKDQEAKKSLFIKIGVSVFIIFIFILWSASLKNVFKYYDQEDSLSFSQISSNLDESIKEAKEKAEEINSQNKNISSSSQDFVNDLIKKTEELTSSSSDKLINPPVSSSTIILEEIKDEIIRLHDNKDASNCPQYINCMPTVGQINSCSVPSGCEKITQIVY